MLVGVNVGSAVTVGADTIGEGVGVGVSVATVTVTIGVTEAGNVAVGVKGGGSPHLLRPQPPVARQAIKVTPTNVPRPNAPQSNGVGTRSRAACISAAV